MLIVLFLLSLSVELEGLCCFTACHFKVSNVYWCHVWL